ncbi:hypothetical protein MUP65_00620 [Patescibacteria group bacterium]|nr:hypothetical protein [Patescibacteria group bacterium]
MKKTTIAFLTIGLVLCFSTCVFATNEATGSSETKTSAQSQRIGLLKDRIEAWQEETQQQVENRQETIQNQISERSKIRVRSLFNLTKNRLAAAIARLENIITRLEARLEKMATNGHDTTEMQSSLNEANLKLDQASQLLTLATQAFDDLLVSVEPAEKFSDIKDLATEIRSLLAEARVLIRTALTQALNEPTNTNQATSSAEN